MPGPQPLERRLLRRRRRLPCCYPAQGGSSIEFNGRSCFAANDGETGGPKMCGSADNSDAAKGLVVDAVVAVVAAVSIYAVALF